MEVSSFGKEDINDVSVSKFCSNMKGCDPERDSETQNHSKVWLAHPERLVLASMLAPLSTRIRTTPAWPFKHARWRGVSFCIFLSLTPTPPMLINQIFAEYDEFHEKVAYWCTAARYSPRCPQEQYCAEAYFHHYQRQSPYNHCEPTNTTFSNSILANGTTWIYIQQTSHT